MDLNYIKFFRLWNSLRLHINLFQLGKAHFAVDRSLLRVEADFSSSRPNVQYTKMQFSKERVSIFTQFSGHSSIGLILLDFTAGVVDSALPLEIAEIAFQFFLQTNGIYSKTEMDREQKSSRSKSSQEDLKHANVWFSQMRNLGTIIENCLGPSLLWMENDTIVHNDSAGLLTEIIQGISVLEREGKGEMWQKEKNSCRPQWRVPRLTAAPLRSDVAVTLFAIYRVLITSTAIFALCISHTIRTLHLHIHLTSLIVLHIQPGLELQIMDAICQTLCCKSNVFLCNTYG